MSGHAPDSLSAYLAWRDAKVAAGEDDVNPFMVWSAGVRFATLTDAERSVLRGLRDDYAFRRSNENCQRVASVLDGLLARLGGAS